MNIDRHHRQGQAAIVAAIAASRESHDALRDTIAGLSDAAARSGLGLLAVQHATATRGGVRAVPSEGIAELVLDAADEHGLPGALEVADTFATADVRAAFGNLLVAARRQRQTIDAAADSAPQN